MPAYKYFTKDGKTKWYANFYYEDWLGNKKHKCKRGFSTKKDAVEWERDFLAQGAKDPDILFSALVKNYMSDCSSRLKLTTLENKQYLIDLKLMPFFKDMKIGDITPIVIHRWQDAMLNYRDENGKPYAQTYLKTINNQMSAIMNYAVKYYKLRSNPCHAAGSIGKSNADEMKIWTREQFDYFLTFEKKSAYRMAFSLMFYGGLRSAEVLALTPEDILPDRSISITKNFVVVKREQYFLTPKTDKSKRIVNIPQSLYDELQEYVASMTIAQDERIFYFQKSGMWAEFKRITARSGLPAIRVHDLRHSHASMLIDMKFSIKEIADRLGHESPETTWRTYAHLYPDRDRKLADALNDVRATNNNIEDI
ncbi:site-specific integrase [Parablautia sp. Marseille-Q6255]|uniref:site-specific integrase n=1 Tax=Parablautia sp. Marseille-Q6255 TaxID=3039593 RepID=UPI0024BC1605|nr:site-specific integrase [Parablautia sp. Marseille-Q6255]